MTAQRRSEPGHGEHRRLQGDEGSIMVESLIILPILMTLLAGLMDFGVGWKDRQLLQAAGRNGARVAGASNNYGAGATADQAALTTVWAGLSSMKNIEVRKVIIFKANPTTWSSQASDALPAPPASCMALTPTASGTGLRNSSGVWCNVYSASQMQNAATTWSGAGAGCSTTTGWDQYWCPATRVSTLTGNSNMGPDYLGLYVEIRYTTFTGYLVKTVDLTDTTIVRLEPRS